VLLADCQTVGGYPKIATVIGADLPRLGHALPGSDRFPLVTARYSDCAPSKTTA
jgi:allophanate hydrolase subunit 2